MALVFFAFPALVCLSLCLLPRGRPAALGIGLGALFAAALWLTAPAGEDGEFRRVLIVVAGAGMAMAGVAQGLRAALGPGAAGWSYPAVIAATLALGAAVFLKLLGA